MRRLPFALALALAAASATAQVAPDSVAAELAPVSRANVHGQAGQAILTVGAQAALATGLLAVAVAFDEAENGTGATVTAALLLATPAVVGGVACGTGALFDLPGSCRGALRGGLIGAVPGMAVMALGFAHGGWDGLGYVFVGGLAYLVVPPFAALEGYRHGARAVPGVAAVRGPDGEVTPVAALSVRF